MRTVAVITRTSLYVLYRVSLYRGLTVYQTSALYNEVLGLTNDFRYPSNSKICEKEPRYNETWLQ